MSMALRHKLQINKRSNFCEKFANNQNEKEQKKIPGQNH